MGAALRRALVNSWNRRGALAVFLWPAAALFGVLVNIRKRLYEIGLLRIQRAAVPVIVVGNVVAGGGGKTPLVIAMVQYLQSRGIKSGVISRGYGRNRHDCLSVSDDSLAEDVGDEPLLIRKKTGAPVFVALARIDAARELLARNPNVTVLVCDDGLQHYGMHRDIEVCVFDERGVGNGYLLPAGPLREPWPRPTDLVLYAGADRTGAGFSVQRMLSDHARRADGSLIALGALREFARQSEKQLWAVAGIAQPETFFAMLRERGLTLSRTMALADHAAFDRPDWSNADGHILVCTEKDAMKLWRNCPDALAVPLVVDIEPAFWSALDQLLVTRAGARLSSIHGHKTAGIAGMPRDQGPA